LELEAQGWTKGDVLSVFASLEVEGPLLVEVENENLLQKSFLWHSKMVMVPSASVAMYLILIHFR